LNYQAGKRASKQAISKRSKTVLGTRSPNRILLPKRWWNLGTTRLKM